MKFWLLSHFTRLQLYSSVSVENFRKCKLSSPETLLTATHPWHVSHFHHRGE